MREIDGPNGGKLIVQEAGDPALPGAGRKKNPFREAIAAYADGGSEKVVLEGELLDSEGKPTGKRARVLVEMPGVQAIVVRMFRKAAKKGDVSAARWLTETGYGKNIQLGSDPDSPLEGGFALVLPTNHR